MVAESLGTREAKVGIGRFQASFSVGENGHFPSQHKLNTPVTRTSTTPTFLLTFLLTV